MKEPETSNPIAPPDSGAANGSKLTTVFAIVLAAHVVIIIIALSWYLLSGGTNNKAVDHASKPANTPAVATTGEPRLETDPAPLISGEVLDTMNATTMPGSTDPVWGAAPAPLPDADPFAEIEPAPTAPAGYTVAPLPPLAPLPQPAPVAVPAETAAALGRPGAPRQATTPTAQKPEVSTPARTTGTTTYRVVQGDTLTRIANRYGTTVAEIKRLNGLTNDALKIGQILNVAGPAPAPTRTAAAPAREWTATHTVAAGETLYRIARNYKTTPAELAKVNKITDPARVRVGTVLRVPGSSTAKAEPKPARPAPAREARANPTLAPAPAPAPAPAAAKPAPTREAKAAPDLKPFRPPVLTQEMVMMNM